MGDWKSEMVWFIADDAVPDPFPRSITDFLNSYFEEHPADLSTQRTFKNYSNDQYTYLSLMLDCYANPAARPLHAWQEDGQLALRFHNRAACRAIALQLDQWEQDFLRDPEPLCAAIHEELNKFEPAYAPAHLIAKVTAEVLLKLYALNDGQGYHSQMDCPASGLIEAIPIRTNTLMALNQGMGFIKAMRLWMREADSQGMGLFSLIY